MQDLSHLLPGDPVTALAPTSQAGGNMMSDNKLAGTAPGSPPVDPLPPAKEQADPKISVSNSVPVRPGTSGKPRAESGPLNPGSLSWTRTTTPDVIRES
jgi:hypothetical protein